MTAIELRPEGTPQTAQLFEAHATRVLAYCQRRLGSRAEAEDALQTVFLYAHRALRRGVVPESEEAWLLSIARNICRWHHRTATRRGGTVGDVDFDAFASPKHDEESEAIQHELEDALASVPERQRQALLLREWRGLSCPEIAEVLEMSPPATHALLTRARRSVAQALAAAGRRPVLGLDFGSLFLQFRGLLSGTAAKAAAVAVGLAGAGVGGYTVEQYLAHDSHAPSPGVVVPSAPGPPTASPVSLPATAPHSFPGSRGGAPQTEHGTATIERSTPEPSTPTATSDPEMTPSVEEAPAGTKDDMAPPETTPAAGLPTVPAPDPVVVAPVDPPTVPLPSIPDPSTPAVGVPAVTVGEVTTPEVTVPGVTVPVSDVTDTVTALLP